MKILYIITLLCIVPYSFAMHSDEEEFLPGGKRGRKQEEQSSSSDKEDAKLRHVKGQKNVQKNEYFGVSQIDTNTILATTDRAALIQTFLRQFLKKKDISVATVNKDLKSLCKVKMVLSEAKQEEEEELKQFFMQCPECYAVIQTDKSQVILHKNFFRHWFLSSRHQPELLKHVGKLIAKSEKDARIKFGKYGLPKVAVVPLPTHNSQKLKPMDCSDDGVDAQEEEVRDEILEQEASWYIVDKDSSEQCMVNVFIGVSRQAVVAQYLAKKVPLLTLECSEVHEQGILFKENEEVVKQLMVQDKKASKKLVCPYETCEQMFEQGEVVSEESLSALLKKMAFHHIKSHPIEDDAVLAQKASNLAAISFEDAYVRLQNN